MITLKTLKWSDAFSYGPSNHMDFDTAQLIQLVGKNGNGKSSIALILEEILYNKNSKNIKKSDILNRHGKVKTYSIELLFTKDNNTYKILTSRGTTQTVQLFCDGEDISSHTSTGTYKLIEEIIGFDHKTFTQIVYQSNAYSLEFLTATDTNRKKFLIDLLNLGVYTRASELFKNLNKEVSSELDTLKLKVKTLNDWLVKFSKEDLTKRNLIVVPEPPTAEVNRSTEFQEHLRTIESTNKKIIQNNKYKEILKAIDISPVPPPRGDLAGLTLQLQGMTKTLAQLSSNITVVQTVCKACGQSIDAGAKLLMVEKAKAEKATLVPEIEELTAIVDTIKVQKLAYDKYNNRQLEWERYHSLFEVDMPSVLLDRQELESELNKCKSNIERVSGEIRAAQASNNLASAHNARIEVIAEQIESMSIDLAAHSGMFDTVQDRLTNIQLLVKTFSTTGLVAYKIECLVKDLEVITNEYLLDLSDGRFQLSFKVNASDKLNVVINDNGQDIDVLALSNGERARVNIATLLAIRRLMQTLSNVQINLLILDETIESLDTDGKEKLIEVLLKEEYLNTVLVSHSFTHPLIEKIHIVKENNISRIE